MGRLEALSLISERISASLPATAIAADRSEFCGGDEANGGGGALFCSPRSHRWWCEVLPGVRAASLSISARCAHLESGSSVMASAVAAPRSSIMLGLRAERELLGEREASGIDADSVCSSRDGERTVILRIVKT